MNYSFRLSLKKSIGILLVGSILLTSPLFFLNSAYAGVLTSSKVTISDSRAEATGVEYDFAFTTTATTAIKQVDIALCTTASGTCTAPTGLSTSSVALDSDNLAGSGRTTSAPAANTLRIVVGTPSTQSTQAVTIDFSGITNPSTTNTTFFARITTYSDTGSTTIDTGTVAFAILTSTSLAVSASLGPTFTFTVAAANSGSVNGASITVTDSTASTIPFGTLTDGTSKVAAHDVAVTTNAANGYSISVKTLADPPLSAASNNIDKFSGTNASPTVWSAPAGSSANVNTGYFGYTTNDTSLGSGDTDRFTDTGNEWAGATTSPLEVAYNSAAVASAETTRLGWQAEINELQPQGSYTGTVILVATPTY